MFVYFLYFTRLKLRQTLLSSLLFCCLHFYLFLMFCFIKICSSTFYGYYFICLIKRIWVELNVFNLFNNLDTTSAKECSYFKTIYQEGKIKYKILKAEKAGSFKAKELKQKRVFLQNCILFCRLAETYQTTCLLECKTLS